VAAYEKSLELGPPQFEALANLGDAYHELGRLDDAKNALVRARNMNPTDAKLRRVRRVGRPASGNAKQLMAIRIAPQLLRQLRRMAAKQSKPYQTLIHELLEKSARRVS